jgi:hypothetical protein
MTPSKVIARPGIAARRNNVKTPNATVTISFFSAFHAADFVVRSSDGPKEN